MKEAHRFFGGGFWGAGKIFLIKEKKKKTNNVIAQPVSRSNNSLASQTSHPQHLPKRRKQEQRDRNQKTPPALLLESIQHPEGCSIPPNFPVPKFSTRPSSLVALCGLHANRGRTTSSSLALRNRMRPGLTTRLDSGHLDGACLGHKLG